MVVEPASLRKVRDGSLPNDAVLYAVVRPLCSFASLVDRNLSALAPSRELLESLEREKRDRKMSGMCEEGAHNSAWKDLNIGERYIDELRASEDARDRFRMVVEEAAEGDVYLVAPVSPRKRSHADVLARRASEGEL
jgi:phage-related protein